PVHTPLAHLSVTVQNRPSSQPVPFSGAGSCTHWSVVSSQLSTVHALVSLQSRAVPPQVPALQTSVTVQNLPSSQLWPCSGTGSCTHWLSPSLQLSAVHGLVSEQSRGVPAQVPFAHTSPSVQKTPSSQLAPLRGAGSWTHWFAASLQLSAVQALVSAQSRAV